MAAQPPIMFYITANLMQLIPWIIVGFLLMMALALFLFLVFHRRNNLRRFAELEEKILFFHPEKSNESPLQSNNVQLHNELAWLRAEVETLKKLIDQAGNADSASMQRIETFKKGIHHHLNELHERIKQNELNTNRILHYLEDLRESIERSED